MVARLVGPIEDEAEAEDEEEDEDEDEEVEVEVEVQTHSVHTHTSLLVDAHAKRGKGGVVVVATDRTQGARNKTRGAIRANILVFRIMGIIRGFRGFRFETQTKRYSQRD